MGNFTINKVLVTSSYITDMANAIRLLYSASEKYKISEIAFNLANYKNTINLFTNSSFFSFSNSKVTKLRNYAFYTLSMLGGIELPACSYVGSNAFYSCTSLTTASLPVCTYIGSYAFYNCSALTAIYLNSVTSVTNLAGSNVFSMCTNLTSIYIPASLFEAFKKHYYWSYFYDCIFST